MFVPFIYSMESWREAPILFGGCIWMSFAHKYGSPVIAQTDYAKLPSYYKNKGRQEYTDLNRAEIHGYDILDDEQFSNLDIKVIPKEVEERFISEQGSFTKAYNTFSNGYWSELEELLEKYISEIEEQGKIDGIITLRSCKTLYDVCARHNIPLIYMEYGPFRDCESTLTAYLTFGYDLYRDGESEQRYEQYMREWEHFQNKQLKQDEILALMLNISNFDVIEKLEEVARYKIGIGLGYSIINSTVTDNFVSDIDMIKPIIEKYGHDVLVRRHPGDPYNTEYIFYDYEKDTSQTDMDFILKCDTVAAVSSNLLYTAWLLGRHTICFGMSPYSTRSACSVNDDIRPIPPLSYLNFIAFNYLVPFKLLWDKEYLLWRLSNPSEKEIFEKHFNYYLERKGLSDPFENDEKNRLRQLVEEQGKTDANFVLKNNRWHIHLDGRKGLISDFSRRNFSHTDGYIGKFYFDIGAGLSEDLTAVFQAKLGTDFISLRVHLPENAKNVRFDPVEGFESVISDVAIMPQFGKLSVTPMNGIAIGNTTYFVTADPMFLIDLSNNAGLSWFDISWRATVFEGAVQSNWVEEHTQLTNERDNCKIKYDNIASEYDALLCERNKIIIERDEIKNQLED